MPIFKDQRYVALAKEVDSLLSTERDALIRPELSQMSFELASDDIDRIRRLMLRLRACDLDLLSDNRFQECSRFVSDVREIFNRMKGFDPIRSATAPQAERDQITQQCKALFVRSNDQLLGAFAIAAPTLQETGDEVRLIVGDARSTATTLLDDVKSQTESARKEVEETLKSIRAATGAIGIEKQAEVFKNAAAEHAAGRARWLAATSTLAFLTVLGLLANWAAGYKMGPPSSSAALIQLTVAKALVFSFLVSAVIWSGKIYRSHQHNYVLNKHRQNALETFQLFARAAEHDPETKAMVLLQATKSIFTPQPTGFLSVEKDSDGSSPQVLEIFRSLTSGNK